MGSYLVGLACTTSDFDLFWVPPGELKPSQETSSSGRRRSLGASWPAEGAVEQGWNKSSKRRRVAVTPSERVLLKLSICNQPVVKLQIDENGIYRLSAVASILYASASASDGVKGCPSTFRAWGSHFGQGRTSKMLYVPTTGALPGKGPFSAPLFDLPEN
jgi:hypothetical protein